jgi:multicomponent Na+:H+ antiporter subunit D
MGIPPSGGFSAKWLLLLASIMEGQWWWAMVMLVGGLLAGGYVFMVLGKAFGIGYAAPNLVAPVARSREMVALVLALCAVLLGFVPLQPSAFLQIGRPDFTGVVP